MERRRERRKVEGMGGGGHKGAECRVRNKKTTFCNEKQDYTWYKQTHTLDSRHTLSAL